MTYPRNFLRLTVSGTLPGGEGWSFGLALANETSTGTDPGPSDVPDAILQPIRNFHNSGMIAGDAVLTMVKLNQVGQDGRYVNKAATVEHEYNPGVAPGASPTGMPYQVAVAVSLLTDARRGPGHRGRFYVPVPTLGAANCVQGEITTSTLATWLTEVKAFLDGLNAAIPNHRVCVASKVGTGAMLPVTSVAIGSRPDIIRSRGASLKETYQVADLAGA